MTECEFFLDRREAESSAFHRVLDALPQDHFDYRPHERSPSARARVDPGQRNACLLRRDRLGTPRLAAPTPLEATPRRSCRTFNETTGL